MKVFDYLVTGSVLMLIVAILYLPVFFVLRKRKIPILKQLSWIGLVGITFVILVATGFLDILLFGKEVYTPYRFLNLIPFSWLFETWSMGFLAMISQVIGNILMFIPFGFLLPIVFKRLSSFKKAVIIIFGFSFSIELIQYFIGRSSDIDDLILNTLGGSLGFMLYVLTDKYVFKKFKNSSLEQETEVIQD